VDEQKGNWQLRSFPILTFSDFFPFSIQQSQVEELAKLTPAKRRRFIELISKADLRYRELEDEIFHEWMRRTDKKIHMAILGTMKRIRAFAGVQN